MTTIVKNIPIPEAPFQDNRGRPAKYPFNDMEVGDAFEIAPDKVAQVKQSCYVKNSKNAAQGKPGQFVVGVAAEGKTYCWRVS